MTWFYGYLRDELLKDNESIDLAILVCQRESDRTLANRHPDYLANDNDKQRWADIRKRSMDMIQEFVDRKANNNEALEGNLAQLVARVVANLGKPAINIEQIRRDL